MSYYSEHKDQILARMKEYNAANKDKVNAYKKAWRKAHPKQNSEIQKKWREKNPDYMKQPTHRYAAAKSAAKRRGKIFTITFDEWFNEISKPCYYCCNKLGPMPEVGIGLDRLDSSKGYIENNICSCCEICNKIKGQYLSVIETKAAINAIIKIREHHDKWHQ